MTAAERGEHLADGGFDPLDVRYPDPAAIARCHAEWPGTSADSAVPGRLTKSEPRSPYLVGPAHGVLEHTKGALMDQHSPHVNPATHRVVH